MPVLGALPRLRKVDLSSCDLGVQGCIAFAGAVKERDGITLVLQDSDLALGGNFSRKLLRISGVNVHRER